MGTRHLEHVRSLLRVISMSYGNNTYHFSPQQGAFNFRLSDLGGVDSLVFLYDHRYSLIIDITPGEWSRLGANQYFWTGTSSRSILENVFAGGGNDQIFGNAANNRIMGNGGNDFARGYNGNDIIVGGAGSDTLYGSNGSDVVRGDGPGTSPNGERWRDVLYGGADNDDLEGGSGADILYGGPGSDRFIFNEVMLEYTSGAYVQNGESDPNAPDIIRGFDNPGAGVGDRIDLRNIDAMLGPWRPGNDSFFFVAPSDGGRIGTLYLTEQGSYTVVNGNTNGGWAPEFRIFIDDGAVRASQYSAVDFYL
jgi:Ca2+-binding RTX toxin-like protein